MIVLLTGASGFIGSHLAQALRAAGHEVIEARRSGAPGVRSISADYTRDLAMNDWLPKLAGVDAVINAVGILRQQGAQSFENVHTRAPQALFAACAAAGVRRVIQISALGAQTGTTGYFRSKRAADEYLATLPVDWTIVQPAVVYGPGGSSARLFTLLASLPLITLPGRGEQLIQPIHIHDLTKAIVQLLSRQEFSHRYVPLVGPQPLSLRELLTQLRSAMGMRPTLFVGLPVSLMRAGARIAGISRHSLLDRDTLAMLEAGNTADPRPTHDLLQRSPRAPAAFIEGPTRQATAQQAKLSWLMPLLRISIAAVWIWTGIVSAGLFPREASYELLARAGITGALAPLMLFGAAALDLSVGLATLFLHRRHVLWLVQMLIIVAYTAIISIKLPEFWLHPYGPVLKNLPLLAGIYLLYSLEKSR